MEEELRPGYYKDKDGNWQQDRRKESDRRARGSDFPHHDRRNLYRRITDRTIAEREARQEIEEALAEFSAEHEHRGEAPEADEGDEGET
ncbi:MAG: hypothetical protein GY851_22345 [bacterium]|nr:hypothetical protein [bacterium]